MSGGRVRALAALASGVALLLLAGCPGGGGEQVDAGGTPIDAPVDAVGCNPDRPVATPPQIVFAPNDLEREVVSQVDGATVSIDVGVYAFTLTNLADRLIAADRRGVPVRVLLDQTQSAANTTVKNRLTGGGVEVKWAPATFPFSHAKYLVIDRDTAVIMSANLTLSGMDDQRNVGLIDRDPTNVADLATIFAADWAGTTPVLDCPRLMISPADARTRVLGLIASAESTLDVEVYYIADTGVRAAIIAAQNRGVAVRVILSDTSEVSDNATTATALESAGVQVRVLSNPVPHIKMIIADGDAALVGSHNLSSTSLRDNREIGEIVRTPAAVSTLRTRLEGDWALARPW